jgi:hypothetical protein
MTDPLKPNESPDSLAGQSGSRDYQAPLVADMSNNDRFWIRRMAVMITILFFLSVVIEPSWLSDCFAGLTAVSVGALANKICKLVQKKDRDPK